MAKFSLDWLRFWSRKFSDFVWDFFTLGSSFLSKLCYSRFEIKFVDKSDCVKEGSVAVWLGCHSANLEVRGSIRRGTPRLSFESNSSDRDEFFCKFLVRCSHVKIFLVLSFLKLIFEIYEIESFLKFFISMQKRVFRISLLQPFQFSSLLLPCMWLVSKLIVFTRVLKPKLVILFGTKIVGLFY